MNSSLKTILWRASITAAIIILIASCFYAEENSRGLAAWRQAEREMTARGESLNWDAYIPPPVPDDQNFFKAPMMTEWFVRSTNAGTSPFYSAAWANPDTMTNFITEASASNYLAWCTIFDSEFSQIRDAVKRPAARMDGDYVKPFQQPVPNFVTYRTVSLVLAHRAKCHLLLGEPAVALDDLTLLYNLNRTLVENGKPVLLVTAMIHNVIAYLYANAVACGLDSRSWREPELAALQKQLAEIHLLPVVTDSLRWERANQCRLLDNLSADEFRRSGLPGPASDLGWWFVPGGWIYQNKAVIASAGQRILNGFDQTNHSVSPYKIKTVQFNTEQTFRRITPWNFIAAMVMPNYNKAALVTARNQTWIDHAQITCALERYRLANGKYPTTLPALVPQYLEKIPNDVITGAQMKYLLKDEQNFLLYSIGWNEADDGGIIVRDRDGAEDRESGDWVWHYPEP